MRYYDNVVELIGNTPLVRLRNVTDGISATVLAKVEYFNPGGSVKDRIALRMVEEAEKSGAAAGRRHDRRADQRQHRRRARARRAAARLQVRLRLPGQGLARTSATCLKAYGAEVVVCPTAVAPEDPRSYYNVSDRLAREIPGAWKPDQYSNPNNPISHYESTGPEIWEQTDGRITHFVAGVGTGGTITGIGRYLKEASGGRVRIIGADPEGSVYSGGTGRPYLVEGVGEDFWPQTYDRTICDEIVEVSDKDSFDMTRRLAREEGLLVGGSCGMAVVAALEVARTAGPDDVVVVLLPDNGRGYLSKIFNDDWMARYGFMTRRHSAREATVADVLAGKTGTMPEMVHVHPTETVRDAIDIMREYGVSQLPVLKAEPPVVTGEVAGSIAEKALLDALFTGQAHLHDTLEQAHGAAAADDRRRPAGLRGGRADGDARTRRWCWSTASRVACSPARTCSPTSAR